MGEPVRARPCRCGPRQLLEEDGLCICGRWPVETVDHTFAQQAWRNAKDQRTVKRPSYVEGKDGRIFRTYERTAA